MIELPFGVITYFAEADIDDKGRIVDLYTGEIFCFCEVKI